MQVCQLGKPAFFDVTEHHKNRGYGSLHCTLGKPAFFDVTEQRCKDLIFTGFVLGKPAFFDVTEPHRQFVIKSRGGWENRLFLMSRNQPTDPYRLFR